VHIITNTEKSASIAVVSEMKCIYI